MQDPNGQVLVKAFFWPQTADFSGYPQHGTEQREAANTLVRNPYRGEKTEIERFWSSVVSNQHCVKSLQ